MTQEPEFLFYDEEYDDYVVWTMAKAAQDGTPIGDSGKDMEYLGPVDEVVLSLDTASQPPQVIIRDRDGEAYETRKSPEDMDLDPAYFDRPAPGVVVHMFGGTIQGVSLYGPANVQEVKFTEADKYLDEHPNDRFLIRDPSDGLFTDRGLYVELAGPFERLSSEEAAEYQAASEARRNDDKVWLAKSGARPVFDLLDSGEYLELEPDGCIERLDGQGLRVEVRGVDHPRWNEWARWFNVKAEDFQ